MYSYFEDIFKRAFLKSIVHTHREISADLSKFDDKDITREYRKILDKVAIGMINETFENEKIIKSMMMLSTLERVIIAFQTILDMELGEISILLDSTPESVYSQKSKALKKLKNALKDENLYVYYL